MTYIIAEPCIGEKDASCVDVCPVDCIYEADDMFYIHPDECIDCGACEPECPVQAIFPDTEVPEEWTDYIDKNYTHFDLPPPLTKAAVLLIGHGSQLSPESSRSIHDLALRLRQLGQFAD